MSQDLVQIIVQFQYGPEFLVRGLTTEVTNSIKVINWRPGCNIFSNISYLNDRP